MAVHDRRKAREAALQALYALDIGSSADIAGHIHYALEQCNCQGAVNDYARQLVENAVKAREEIDALIQKHSANWEIKRMAAVDRNILRVSIGELLYCRNVPFKVVIDEAVEIAKSYGTDDSGKFVNGVLDSIREEIGERNTRGKEAKNE